MSSNSASPAYANPPSWLGRGVAALSLLLIGWFYLWTAMPEEIRLVSADDGGSYYNLLARGLLKGGLALDAPADPALATVPDPYDPVSRGNHGLHDASYYKGKYYIYFGVTPVLLFYLPFHFLTGAYLTDAAVIVGCAMAALWVAWMLVRAVIRMHFPRTTLSVQLACLWALGLVNLVPSQLLRRPAMWEVPIACAMFLFMLVLFFIWQALTGKRRSMWVALASLVMGLCVGARPTYLGGSVVLLAPLILLGAAAGRACWRQRAWWQLAAVTVIPIACVGAGLALYNYLRFENPFEFGQTYQMAGVNVTKIQVLGLGHVLYNLRVYLLEPAGLSPYFPFLTVIDLPPLPPGHLGAEDPYGIIPGMPWVLLALAALGWMRRNRGTLGLWIGLTFVATLLVLLTVCCFAGATGRYEVDFTPAFTLLGAVGALALAHDPAGARRRTAVTALVAGLCVWSCAFNILLGFQHNRLLEQEHPRLYARIARAFNRAPHWLARMTGHRDGPVEIRLVFPNGKKDKIEPLVVTGHEFLSDYLFVHYLDPGLIRFGLEHTSRGSWMGPATRIDPEAEHTVLVQMGSLYPPAEHPVYDDLSLEEADVRTRTVKVKLNGRTVLDYVVDCYDASDWQPAIGTSGPARPAFKDDFSGRILGWKRVPSLADATTYATGKLHLVIRLPPFTRARSEPLLSTGMAGAGDLIYIRYLDATHFQIGHDRWGYGGSQTPVIEYDPNVPVDLDIACPPLLGPGAAPRLVITKNDSTLLDREEAFHPSRPTQIVVGRNLIGASTAEAEFTGVIELQERVRP